MGRKGGSPVGHISNKHIQHLKQIIKERLLHLYGA